MELLGHSSYQMVLWYAKARPQQLVEAISSLDSLEVMCVDHLGSALCRLATRDAPSPYTHDGHRRLRMIAPADTFPQIAAAAFNQIRQHGRSSAAVTIHLLETIAVIAGFTHRPEDRAALLGHAEMIGREPSAPPIRVSPLRSAAAVPPTAGIAATLSVLHSEDDRGGDIGVSCVPPGCARQPFAKAAGFLRGSSRVGREPGGGTVDCWQGGGRMDGFVLVGPLLLLAWMARCAWKRQGSERARAHHRACGARW